MLTQKRRETSWIMRMPFDGIRGSYSLVRLPCLYILTNGYTVVRLLLNATEQREITLSLL
jgi:hypothetical protein